jgi:diguanylate cyclase
MCAGVSSTRSRIPKNVSDDKDWKEKYYDSLQNLDDHQERWNELEELLRKAITRLAITAKGIDRRLDKVLADIQKQVRAHNDAGLTEALEALSRVLAQIDDQADADADADADAVQAGADEAGGHAQPFKELAARLHIEESRRGGLDAFVSSMDQLDSDQRIDGFAREINGLLKSEASPVITVAQEVRAETAPEASPGADDRDAVREVLITLVEKIAFTHGESEHLNHIKKLLDSGFDGDSWHSYLDEIISEVRVIIDGVNDEKGELENLIVDVTKQLSEISKVLNEERAAHLEGREQARALQTLMDDSVDRINVSVDTISDIHQLKLSINENLGAIKSGIHDFAASDAERFRMSEARNARLVEQIGVLEKESEQLKLKLSEDRRKLMFDALTGARSRLSYEEVLEQELYRWRRYKDVFSFAILDIDHFKQINDQYGHNAGDKALQVVARIMGKNIRKTDFLFRIGGEEFVLLLPKTDLPGSEPLVEKLRASIGAMDFHFKQQRVVITLSAGLTTIVEGDSAESIYERADKALYQAKNNGRDRLVVIGQNA